MSEFLSREQLRALDRQAIAEYGLPGAVLMENAGRGVAELLRSLGVHGQVVICAGKGNNGGDGFVIARHLDNRGVSVRVLLFANPEALTGDAALHYGVIAKSAITIRVLDGAAGLSRELAGAEWIVDALFGTGLAGPVRSPFDQIIRALNASLTRVLAVDIPSGLDCNTGEPLGTAVRAHHTATLCAFKKGFANPQAEKWLGQIHLVDIGVPRALLERLQDPGTNGNTVPTNQVV
jgi:NAD(P)H-hydrate epimerase